ncbi:MAG: hypothetical protein ACE5E1_02690 [Phycisphaerae bacterium]
MAIVVRCKCGKSFKAKNHMSGRKVRCPGCKEALRIPGEKVASGTAGGSGKQEEKKSKSAPVVSPSEAEAALLRFEEAQKRKQINAEAEAALREEKNKLIASYDQLTGRTQPKGKEDPKKRKGEFTEGPLKKVTVFTRIADVFGAVFGTLIARYVLVVLLLGGGALGSVYLVKFMTTYTQEEISARKPKEAEIRELFVSARTALNDGDLAACSKCLNKIIDLDPGKERHRTYIDLKKRLEQAYSKP